MKEHFEFLILEKKFKSVEMLEYNKRLDKIILIYISSLFAVLGLRATGQIQLESYLSDIDFVFLAFIFVILNQCILLHTLSQSTYAISLAKYIHTEINAQIYKILNQNTENFDCLSLKDLSEIKQIEKRNSWGFLDWDDWELEIKDVSNSTRGIVFSIWVIAVMSISLSMLCIVRLNDFYNQNTMVSLIFLSIILMLQLVINYYGLKYAYCISKFHVKTEIVANDLKNFKYIGIVGAIIINIIFIILYLCFN